MGFRQNGTFASQKEADDEEMGYHLVGHGLYLPKLDQKYVGFLESFVSIMISNKFTNLDF